MPLFGTRGAASVTGFGGLAKLGYLLRNSLRFRKSASGYLSRTMSSSSTTYTVSAWVKRGSLTGYHYIFASGPNTASDDKGVAFDTTSSQIYVFNGSTQALSTAVFRDPAAWYHVVMSVNSGTATVYVNNVNTGISQSSMALGTNGRIGRFNDSSSANDFDGYMAEFNLIDGQALTPSSFGKTDPVTGQWIPIKYGSTYGTAGFYLNFTDASAATAAAIGKDSSGNGNNWTPNNISVTAGATYDSMTDVPTLTSATAANYCTLNPIAPNATYAIGTLQDGNLAAVAGGFNNEVQGTFGVTSGKWYFEYSFATSATRVGIATGGHGKSAIATKGVLYENSTGNKVVDSVTTAYGATFNQTNVIGVALDADANSVTFYKDNVSQGSISFTPTDVVSPSIFTPNGVTLTVFFNAGQRPFAYTPPSGFKNLNTFNLP